MRQSTREITYAFSAETKLGQTFVRTVENLTGRISLIRRAKGYEDEVAAGRDFWALMVERYGLKLDVVRGSLDNIPKTGPLVMLCNHPYGILDGLMMGHILSQTRGDFRILANQVFSKANDINRIILPISFDETKEAVKLNLETRKVAIDYLASGGSMGVFPGGTVSTSARPFGVPLDPGWRTFTGKLIAKSGATVVPVFFDGHNSRLFQVASHLHYNFRMALLINEFRRRVGTDVKVAIGDPIPAEEIKKTGGSAREMMDNLRAATYGLSPEPLSDISFGHEFEDHHRRTG